VSYAWNITSGASIILVSGIAYLLSLLLKPVLGRRAPEPIALGEGVDQRPSLE